MARIFITGSTDGLGRAAAEHLIGEGHDVVLHARDALRAEALGSLAAHSAGVVHGDLASAEQTRDLAGQVNALGVMDAVIHNAGIYSTPDRGATPEGHATIFAVNTLASYTLTALIARPKRLVYLSSTLHRQGEGSLADPDWKKRNWDAAKAYAETKLQVAALAFALARHWPDTLSNAVDPGWVRTRMGGANAPVSLDKGQRTQSWLAASDDPQVLSSGGYWRNQKRETPAPEVAYQTFQDALLGRLAQITGIQVPAA